MHVSTERKERGKGPWAARQNVPVNLALVLKQTQRNTVHGGITPALVEETAGAVEVVKVVRVGLAAPDVQVGNLKVGPEVACGVAVGLVVVLGAAHAVRQPVHGIVGVDVLRVLGDELDRLRPQGWDGLWSVKEVDGEPVRLVVVLHVAEDIVVDVAEEVHLGLDAPVELNVLQSLVAVEQAAVPAAHLVVRDLVGILDFVLLENLDRLGVQVLVDVRGDFQCSAGMSSARERSATEPEEAASLALQALRATYRIGTRPW